MVVARRAAGATHIEVWDTGPGIQKSELTRVFDEFYRGESSKGESVGGFGLGLLAVAAAQIGQQAELFFFRDVVIRAALLEARRAGAEVG